MSTPVSPRYTAAVVSIPAQPEVIRVRYVDAHLQGSTATATPIVQLPAAPLPQQMDVKPDIIQGETSFSSQTTFSQPSLLNKSNDGGEQLPSQCSSSYSTFRPLASIHEQQSCASCSPSTYSEQSSAIFSSTISQQSSATLEPSFSPQSFSAASFVSSPARSNQATSFLPSVSGSFNQTPSSPSISTTYDTSSYSPSLSQYPAVSLKQTRRMLTSPWPQSSLSSLSSSTSSTIAPPSSINTHISPATLTFTTAALQDSVAGAPPTLTVAATEVSEDGDVVAQRRVKFTLLPAEATSTSSSLASSSSSMIDTKESTQDQGLTETIKEKLSETATRVQTGAKNLGHTISEGAKNVASTVSEGAKEMAQTVAEGASTVKNNISEKASALKEKISAALQPEESSGSSSSSSSIERKFERELPASRQWSSSSSLSSSSPIGSSSSLSSTLSESKHFMTHSFFPFIGRSLDYTFFTALPKAAGATYGVGRVMLPVVGEGLTSFYQWAEATFRHMMDRCKKEAQAWEDTTIINIERKAPLEEKHEVMEQVLQEVMEQPPHLHHVQTVEHPLPVLYKPFGYRAWPVELLREIRAGRPKLHHIRFPKERRLLQRWRELKALDEQEEVVVLAEENLSLGEQVHQALLQEVIENPPHLHHVIPVEPPLPTLYKPFGYQPWPVMVLRQIRAYRRRKLRHVELPIERPLVERWRDLQAAEAVDVEELPEIQIEDVEEPLELEEVQEVPAVEEELPREEEVVVETTPLITSVLPVYTMVPVARELQSKDDVPTLPRKDRVLTREEGERQRVKDILGYSP